VNSLNLGCGRDIRKGWINLDIASLPGVDVVHDLRQLPLPFEDEQFDRILAKDVLEHVDYIPLLKELHRILRPGGELMIQVPHFTSADNYVDPTHKSKFSVRTLEFFISDSKLGREYYFDFSFQRIARRHIGFLRGPLFYNYLVELLVNSSYRIQKYYEVTFLSALFPAQNISVTIVK
jgi:SAM-dependent methyltransferase